MATGFMGIRASYEKEIPMLNLRLPPEVYATLQFEASTAGISVAAYVARLLTTHTKLHKA